MSEKVYKNLVPDTVPLLKNRKGGVADVIFISLVLEAARMVDDGLDIPSIEGAAKKAFDIPKGFLSQMDDMGIDVTISCMFSLSDSSNPDDPLYQAYNNFFTPSDSCKEMLEKYNQAKDKSSVKWVSEEDSRKEPKDFMLVELLERRFLGVVFMTATEVVNAGVVKLENVDKLCKDALQWKEGPYSLMNKIGIGGVMRIVTEKMVLSHRKEINFPIPRLLISQAQKNQPWPLTGD